jgi:hypothetical protein
MKVEDSLFDGFTFRNIARRAGRMRRYFIDKVFVLQEAPPDEPMSANIEVGTWRHSNSTATLVLLDDALVWTGMPEPFQFQTTCELIYEHLNGPASTRHGIMSLVALKAELDRPRLARTFRSVIGHRVLRKAFIGTVSGAIEQALRFMRRCVAYTREAKSV